MAYLTRLTDIVTSTESSQLRMQCGDRRRAGDLNREHSPQLGLPQVFPRKLLIASSCRARFRLPHEALKVAAAATLGKWIATTAAIPSAYNTLDNVEAVLFANDPPWERRVLIARRGGGGVWQWVISAAPAVG